MNRRIIIRISFNTFGFSENRLSEEWIKERLEIFQKYTLESLKNQDNQNFISYVEYDKSTESIIFEELKKYKQLPENISFVDNAIPYIYKEIKDYKYLYLVRLDSDDMFCSTFISQLHAFEAKEDTQVLINQQGFIYDTVNKQLGDYYDQSPPFYTLIYKSEDYLKGIRYKMPNGHEDAIKLRYEIMANNNYLVTVHSKNTTTRFNSYHTNYIMNDRNEIDQMLLKNFNFKDATKDNRVTVLMYHYVKAVNPSGIERYNLTREIFENQIEDFTKQYNIVAPKEFLLALENKAQLPEKPLLLTFDDGYMDHYENVFPVLAKRNIRAFFFPCAMPLLEGGILNTNKVQFIMDYAKDKEALLNYFVKLVNELPASKSNSALNAPQQGNLLSVLERNAHYPGCSYIIDRLFQKYVPYNEKQLARELYMSIKQLKEMKDFGMHIGCHSYNHYWMSSLKPSEQAREIDKSMELLIRINRSKKNWVMCYPYGIVNNSLIDVIRSRGCIAGFTTAGGSFNLQACQRFTLPRCNISKF